MSKLRQESRRGRGNLFSSKPCLRAIDTSNGRLVGTESVERHSERGGTAEGKRSRRGGGAIRSGKRSRDAHNNQRSSDKAARVGGGRAIPSEASQGVAAISRREFVGALGVTAGLEKVKGFLCGTSCELRGQ